MANRLPYIDVCKGILILFVVLVHLPQQAFVISDQKFVYLETMNEFRFIVGCFFMPAFFLVTGYCSNFKVGWKSFLIKNLRTLIIPGIIFSVFLNFILYRSYVMQGDWNYMVAHCIKTVLMLGSFWFLKALFFSKVALWLLVNKFANRRLLVVIVSVFVAMCATAMHDLWALKDPYNLFHTAVLLPFLVVGFCCKEWFIQKNFYISMLFLYVSSLTFLYCMNINVPTLGMIFSLNLKSLALFFFLALTGSFSTVFVSKWMGENRFLEILGRYSLIIYMTSHVIMQFFEYVWLKIGLLPISVLSTLCFYFLTLGGTLIVCISLGKIVMGSKLRVIMGKV